MSDVAMLRERADNNRLRQLAVMCVVTPAYVTMRDHTDIGVMWDIGGGNTPQVRGWGWQAYIPPLTKNPPNPN